MTYSIMESNREIKNEGTKQKERRIKSEGTERVHEDEKWVVVRPTTIEASRIYGMGCRWCTSMKGDSGSAWLDTFTRTGGLYYILEKGKNPRNDRFAKVCLYKKWSGREYWFDTIATIRTKSDSIELERFKGKLNKELIKNINDDWETIKDTPPKEFNINSISLIKSYINNRLLIHITSLIRKWFYPDTIPKHGNINAVTTEQVKTITKEVFIITVNFIIVSPILLIIYLIKSIKKLF